MSDSNETVEFDEKIAELMPVLPQSEKGRCSCVQLCMPYGPNRLGSFTICALCVVNISLAPGIARVVIHTNQTGSAR